MNTVGFEAVAPPTGEVKVGVAGAVKMSSTTSSVFVPVVLLPLMVKVLVADDAPVVVTVRVTEVVGVTLLALREADVPEPPPLTDRLTGSAKVPKAVTSMGKVVLPPAQTDWLAFGEVMVKSLVIPLITKVLSETSKNVPLAHCTIIKALLDGVLGTVMDSLPSFGTLLAITLKVCPPSRERRISTLPQLTGLDEVLATSHVTFWTVEASQVIPELFGFNTRNGPELPSTLTTRSSWSLHPPPLALSRTVTRKSIDRETDGKTSQTETLPAMRS